jgi:hypothetical protein
MYCKIPKGAFIAKDCKREIDVFNTVRFVEDFIQRRVEGRYVPCVTVHCRLFMECEPVVQDIWMRGKDIVAPVCQCNIAH